MAKVIKQDIEHHNRLLRVSFFKKMNQKTNENQPIILRMFEEQFLFFAYLNVDLIFSAKINQIIVY